ncbi:tRNA-dihydrouridine synthase [Amycolatopsis cihanbeyliensis]|uniref:2,4-dienoyl-CoA reductase-like NADH-dependent reductase (Old Yellow Enzyme family) n=1 Tax=Amycolatopsis cihanbeyliensis TaxID=1128664 RepID=A0A542DQX0_AMYCI|nr:NADH:flavin oxidoreductase [Amycolatopsis cihanbeyliensis]TQJ05501.1 2,4-dienoyl-CoA reductase-like NADH-dependent reductase (Old Yellow Enzyme family) [Amycolatopsis cihanbeyliensis]
MSMHPALKPVRLGDIELSNRVAVAPMSRVSTRGDGVPTAEMAAYYRRFARGGFGLVISEGTYTDEQYSQAYPDQPAMVTAAQLDGWRRVTDAVHEAGAAIVLQLMHAGALSQHNNHITGTIGPSAVSPKGARMPAYGGEGPFALPAAASVADLARVAAGFAAAAAHAKAAGFDGVEVHGANGYLIDQFLTTYTNLRTDRYGGDAAGRVRFATEVLRAVRAAVGAGFPVGIRLSQTKVNDPDYRWPGDATEAETIFHAVAEAGADYLHLASEGRAWMATATLDNGVSISRLARTVTGLPVIANGGMHVPDTSRSVLAEGHADLVAIGRGALANPDWPGKVAAGDPLRDFDGTMLKPDVTLASQAAWERVQP